LEVPGWDACDPHDCHLRLFPGRFYWESSLGFSAAMAIGDALTIG
jgi:hypothetical protein